MDVVNQLPILTHKKLAEDIKVGTIFFGEVEGHSPTLWLKVDLNISGESKFLAIKTNSIYFFMHSAIFVNYNPVHAKLVLERYL